MLNNNEQPNSYKIILITFRLPENPDYRPAEEIFTRIILTKLKLNYQKIEYNSNETSNLFGRLPCLYFNGKLILCRNIFSFIKDLITFGNNEDFETFFDIILFLLRDQFRTANEFYYYYKHLQKLENKKNFLQKFFAKNNSYELFINDIFASFSNININLTTEDKIVEINKHVYSKLNKIKSKIFEERSKNYLIQFLVFAFLEEDRLKMLKLKRPGIESLKHEESIIFNAIGAYYNKADSLKNENLSLSLNEKNLETILDKYSIVFDQKGKKNKGKLKVNEVINQKTFTYNIVSIGLFLTLGTVLFLVSKNQRNKKIK